ncbi:Panacea domain-containing protein [Candidatus Marithrix sp. Canyon 246]|uniref:Panacea domain-containing protein n=1 Tax=Candidatus Marithrix sp. Canyon 246 TaxID=1827136 RepID=UPI000849F562|nr:Panacea domain-containing protein [Candidatus Marithrix sp. Canyon 246]
MTHPFVFNIKKAIEAILYIAASVEQPSFDRICKIMYFADKQHLEKYGRFICGDNYIAMKDGPIPSGMYDLLKSDSTKQNFRVQDEFLIHLLRAAQLDYFSESDLECLKQASQLSIQELSKDLSWQTVDENDYIKIEQIIATFSDAESLLDYLCEPCYSL